MGSLTANKRTAILLSDLPIKRSGYRLVGVDENEDLEVALEELAISVARGDLRIADTTAWFKQRIARR
jgi:prophage maintenance system killer protein